MKPRKDVQKDRNKSHASSSINSVHRSSLLIPKLPANETYISFLNHFLIKRNISLVALKISAYNKNGYTADSVTFEVKEEKIYVFHLEELFKEFEIHSFQLEFFSSENLYFPFPAVMINHISKANWNIVHSYNRVLNDSAEDDKISTIQVDEAAIDLVNTSYQKTFILFHAGQYPLQKESQIEFTLIPNKEKSLSKKAKYNLENINKMSYQMIFVNEVFKDLPTIKNPEEYTLKVKPPKQNMFFGRMLIGSYDIKSSSISGNHSYYDSSTIKEYFQEKRSYRTYPYIAGFLNSIRFYPIISPSNGDLSVYANYINNNSIESKQIFNSEFNPHNDSITISIDDLAKTFNLKNIKTFSVEYKSKDSLGAPSRVNHQLSYAPKDSKFMATSINVSLNNDEIFNTKPPKSHTWIQVINSNELISKLAICYLNFENENLSKKTNINNQIELLIYDSKGLHNEISYTLENKNSIVLDSFELCSSKFFWVLAKSNRAGLNLYTFHSNKKSGQSSGEHGF